MISVSPTPSSGCPALADPSTWANGTVHGGTVTGDETWTAEGSPHRLPAGIHVLPGGSVTITPCAVVLVGTGQAIVVQDNAAWMAVGTATQPIWIGSMAHARAPGSWLGIEVRRHARPATRFAWVTVDAGGGQPSDADVEPAGIRTESENGLDVFHVAVEGSGGWGVVAGGHGGFSADSEALTIVGAQGEGAVLFDDVDQVRTLPIGSYDRNAHGRIVIAAHARTVFTTGTWRNPGVGVAYRVRRGARLSVEGVDGPALTVAPGTVITFEDDAELDVGWDAPGALVVNGIDEAHRIRLVGTTSGRARWAGLYLGPHTDVGRTRIRWAEIVGAGAETSADIEVCASPDGRVLNQAMMYIQNVDAARDVTFTRFRDGPSDGFSVVRSGDFEKLPGDYTTAVGGNDFSGAGTRCRQSMPRVRGRCPATPWCD